MVTGKGLRWNSFERVLRSKVVDPRSKTKNSGIQPLFLAELASSKLKTTHVRSSNNFMPLSTNAHREFLYKFVPSIEDENIKFAFIPTYRRDKVVSIRYLFNQSNEISFGFDLDVTEDIEENSSLADILNRINDVEFDRNQAFSATDDLKSIINMFRKRRSTNRSKRSAFANDASIFLCKNMNGQVFFPVWDRCGEAPSSKTYQQNTAPESVQCWCDDGCLDRQDCCTDFLTSCKGEQSFQNSECIAEKDFECSDSSFEGTTILISTDGFRESYLSERKEFLPTYMKFRECGSFPEFMEPSYPSKTFPNHHTLMTGLYPGQHGIVANKWYDWKKDASCNVFSANTGEHPCNVSSPEEGWWSGDPFWNTVERHDMISASCLWAGNDLTINGEQPTYFWDYGTYGEEPFGYRIYQMLKWLNLPPYPGSGPKEGFRPKFLTLYFDEPDHIGHGFGPYDASGELDAALKRVDFQLQQLMDGLKLYNLEKCVNIVLTTDHGMEQALCEDMVAIAPVFDAANPEIMKTTNFLTKTTTAQMGGLMGSNKSDSFNVMEVIDTVKCTWHGNSFKVWDKYFAPKRLHYDNASPAIEVLLFYMKREAKIIDYPWDSCSDEGYKGNHGWDTKYGGMKVPLTLYGPKIRPNVVLPPIQNVEVFRLLMDLLGIKSKSPKLMQQFYSKQFSLDGRFEPALKRPTNPAKQPVFSGDVSFPTGVTYNKSSEIAFDVNHKFATYAKCIELDECIQKLKLGFEENPMLEFFDDPFWWHTLKDDMLPRIFTNNVKSLRFGAAFDTTGTGVYVPPTQWMSRTENKWCNRQGVYQPSHMYFILEDEEGSLYPALYPWRHNTSASFESEYSPCIVINEEETRQLYFGNFNCRLTFFIPFVEWWQEKLEIHSVRLLEIERMTGMEFLGEEDRVRRVALRSTMNVEGDLDWAFKEPSSSSVAALCSFLSFSFLFQLIIN
ncbi:unnamed protein product [Oikopleura dioica]|uniref:SMB domain-containing protein n=1 Tax=Oikopleura dioica TaxID=34765 RepID=E4X1C1_OIKDI|nr:unnamed protein product [Oikopleura dioica]